MGNMWTNWEKEKLREKEINSWHDQFMVAASDKEVWHELYKEYRKSDVFRDLARKVKIRANGCCEGCEKGDSFLKVIHKTFIRIGGSELLEDCVALCLDCRAITDRVEERVKNKRSISKEYRSRILGLATKHYGATWRERISFEDVESTYISSLYKKYCEKYQLPYNAANPEMDLQFWIFWEDLIEGFPNLTPEK